MSEMVGHVEKTGHQYYGTFLEECEDVGNCGTCDAARCDSCKTWYVVEDYETNKLIYKGPNKESALEIAGYNFCD